MGCSKHELRACAAYKKSCYKCDGEEHFARMCKSKSQRTDHRAEKAKEKDGMKPKVNVIKEESEESDEECMVSALVGTLKMAVDNNESE